MCLGLTSTHCTQGVCDNHCYGNGSQYQDVDLACRMLLPVGYRSHFLIPFTSTHPCSIVTVECKCWLLIWTLFNYYYLAAQLINMSLKMSLIFGKVFFFLPWVFLNLSELTILKKGGFQCSLIKQFCVCSDTELHAVSLFNFSHKHYCYKSRRW